MRAETSALLRAAIVFAGAFKFESTRHSGRRARLSQRLGEISRTLRTNEKLLTAGKLQANRLIAGDGVCGSLAAQRPLDSPAAELAEWVISLRVTGGDLRNRNAPFSEREELE